jgi:hypothetical protein
MYSRRELVILARAYLAASGIAASTLGITAAGNDRLFIRLFKGLDCKASTAERASLWFEANWPPQGILEWPAEVRRLRLGNRKDRDPRWRDPFAGPQANAIAWPAPDGESAGGQ